MQVGWDPQVYARYGDERSRPFHDLVARVGAQRPARVVDLGCGTGALTASLAQRWPEADVLGVDSSPEMVAGATGVVAGAGGRLRVELGDIARWEPEGPVDVLVTNAALQWVPGHLDMLPRWVDALADDGWLALQVPGNFDSPSHQLLRETATLPAYRDRLEGWLRPGNPSGDPQEYAEVLAATGCVVDAWETTYLHVLDPAGEHGEDAVLAWVSGTALRPVLAALDDDPALVEAFTRDYAERLRVAYPRRPWGTPLAFRRVFAVAHKPGRAT